MANLEWASELASDLIGDYGAQIDVTVFFPGIPTNPWEEAEPEKVEYKGLTGLFTRFREELVNGTLIKSEDRRVLVPGLDLGERDFEARIRAHITLAKTGQIWQVQDISRVAPDENTIIYIFHARK